MTSCSFYQRAGIVGSLALLIGMSLSDSVLRGQLIRLSAQLAPNESINNFVVTPNQRWLTYTTETILERLEHGGARIQYGSLFSVPLRGGQVTRLDRPQFEGGSVYPYWPIFTSDSRSVLFIGMQETPNVANIYRAAIDGSSFLKLSDNTFSYSLGHNYFSAMSTQSRVVYQESYLGDLRSASLSGDPSTRLNEPLEKNASTYLPSDWISQFLASPDSSRIAYLRGRSNNLQVFKSDLYSVRSDGTEPLLLANRAHYVHHITPDGKYAVFERGIEVADPVYPNRIQRTMFSVPMAGGPEVMLHPPLPYWGSAWAPWVTPDSAQVILQLNIAERDSYELYRAPIRGGSPMRLNNPLREGDYLIPYGLTPDGRSFLYSLVTTLDDTGGLYKASLDGGPVVQLSPPLPPASEAYRVVFNASATQLAFQTYSASGDDVYIGSIMGGSVATKIELPMGATVNFVGLTSFHDTVVFSMDTEGNGDYELFRASPADPVPYRIGLPIDADGNSVRGAQLFGNTVVFMYGGQYLDNRELFAIRIPEPSSGLLLVFAVCCGPPLIARRPLRGL